MTITVGQQVIFISNSKALFCLFVSYFLKAEACQFSGDILLLFYLWEDQAAPPTPCHFPFHVKSLPTGFSSHDVYICFVHIFKRYDILRHA